MRLSILLILFILSACTNSSNVLVDEQNTFTEDEFLEIESSLRNFNNKYEVFIDVVVTSTPKSFASIEPSKENMLRILISPNKQEATLITSKQIQKVFPQTLASKLENQILKKYINRNEPVKGILV